MSFIDIVKGTYGAAKEFTKAHIPEICEIAAGVLSAAALATAVKAGNDISKEGIVTNFKEELRVIDEDQNDSKVSRGTKKIRATGRMVGRVTKKVAVPIALQAASTGINHYGYGSLKTKVGLLAESLALVSANQDKVIDNVYNALPEEQADEAVTGGKYEAAVSTVVDQDGNATTVGSKILASDIDKLPPNYLVYTRSTVDGSSPQLDEVHFKTLIENVKANALRIMDGPKHHVFLNEALKPLGMDVTDRAYYRTFGSIQPTARQIANGGDKNLGKFDIWYKPIVVTYPDDSTENGWLINVVCDGPIINYYEKYLF